LLSGNGILFLLSDCLALGINRFVKAIEKFLIIAPLSWVDAVLSRLLKTCGVFVAILLQKAEFGFCIAFVGNQSGKTLCRIVCANLHQIKNGLE